MCFTNSGPGCRSEFQTVAQHVGLIGGFQFWAAGERLLSVWKFVALLVVTNWPFSFSMFPARGIPQLDRDAEDLEWSPNDQARNYIFSRDCIFHNFTRPFAIQNLYSCHKKMHFKILISRPWTRWQELMEISWNFQQSSRISRKTPKRHAERRIWESIQIAEISKKH